jgi:hypothetical protein
MIKDLHKGVDKLNATFDNVNHKIGEFVHTQDNCVIKTILYLSITAVVLLVLLIFV